MRKPCVLPASPNNLPHNLLSACMEGRGAEKSEDVQRRLSKVQSVDQRMRPGMRCPLSPTADVPSHTSGAAMCQEPASTHLFDHVADLPFDDLINYPISRSIAVNSN